MKSLNLILLKIAIGSLVAESLLIKQDEQKALWYGRMNREIIKRELREGTEDSTIALGDTQELMESDYELYWNLHQFRKETGRRLARNTLLAYAFLRGVPYAVVEQNVHNRLTEKDWDTIRKTVHQFSPDDSDSRELEQQFAQWKDEAIDSWKSEEKTDEREAV